MERPNLFPIFTKKSEFCEETFSQPVETFVPHQSYSLSELVQRFERGQRLPVHCNFTPGDNMTKDHIYEEDFDDAAPDDVHDVVDVEHYYYEHEDHKREYKKKKSEKQAKQADPALQAKPSDDSTPPDPASPAKD